MTPQRGVIRILAIMALTVAAAWTGCAAERATPPSTTPPSLTLATPAPASPSTHANRILTFGGGSSPANSQASLEQNVLYFRRVLGDLHLDGVHQDTYFTDGTTTGRTVQVRLKPNADMELRETIAGLFGEDGSSIELNFRPAQLTPLAGPSTPAAITSWFDSAAKSMSPNDRLLVYFTGHGGPLARPRGPGMRGPAPAPTTPGTLLETWNDGAITTRDFVTQLDKLNPSVDVTLIMVQCFSGGFANVIYNGGDPAKGLSKSHRCGFFSTVATRPAAGCTPDIEGDNYEEFSTSFFAALSGKTRAGQAVEKPDYDKDGITSFAEAFTYVLLTSNTIDIPMMTSDQLLRDKSKFGRAADPALVPADAPYATILATATPAQRAALEGLSTQLALTGDGRLAAARKMAADLDRERVDVQRTARDAEAAVANSRTPIRQMVLQRWPELAVRWHPGLAALLARDAHQIDEAIATHPAFEAWKNAQTKLDAAFAKDNELERKWVKVERFLTRADVVILAANLGKVATPEVVEAYKDLTARENQTLTSWK